jgi:hypothetical protein
LNMTFHEARMRGDIRLVFLILLHFLIDRGEYLSDRLTIRAAYAVKKRISGFGIELYRSHSGAILPAIMLLFHQQVELVEAPHNRTMLLLVIREWFPQPDECQAAFMLYLVAQ